MLSVCDMAYADTTPGDVATQLKELQSQLGELRAELGKLAERVEKIEASLPPPRKNAKVSVDLDGAPRFGHPDAKIGMVEFSDYQCPFCRRFHLETFPQLQETYIDTGKLLFIVRNFPLDFHPQAMDAAVAVNCARQQNIKAFWDLQVELFSHQDRLGRDFYQDLIKRYKLDQKKYSSCLDDTHQKAAIIEDLKYARSLDVQGTPTFFIGRIEGDRLVDAVRVVGARPYRIFAQALDSLIVPAGAK